jgi:hypothetical protein
MIGDTPYDAEAGLKAGTAAACVLTAGFTTEVLVKAGCFAVADVLRALLPSLECGGPDAIKTARTSKAPTALQRRSV